VNGYEVIGGFVVIAVAGFALGYALPAALVPQTAKLRLQRRVMALRCVVDDHMPMLRKSARAAAVAAYVEGFGEGHTQGRLARVTPMRAPKRRPS
jgi:hypothetical protein